MSAFGGKADIKNSGRQSINRADIGWTRRVRVTNVGPISSLRTRRGATVQSRDSTGFRRLATDASREGSRPMLRWLLQRQIAEGMDVSRPAVSQHLKVLKAAGLIVVRAEGTRRMY